MSPGDYLTPDGGQRVDAARIKHWNDTLQSLLKNGIKPPISWGHVSDATPHTEDDGHFWTSRNVAGKLTGCEIDPVTGEWILHGDAPGIEEMDAEGRLITWVGRPDGSRLKTAIEEVSIGAMDWTDGKGRQWKDAPVHLALTPLPVWVPEGGQPPFEPAQFATKSRPVHFGRGNLLVRFGGPVVADEKLPPAADVAAKPGGDGGPKNGYSIDKLVKLFNEGGFNLPPDTNEENILERLYVVMHHKAGEDNGDDTPGGGAAPPAPMEAGAFMSTIKDPLTRYLAEQVEATQKRDRLVKLEALKARGLSAHEVKGLREEITKVRFSLAGGKPVSAAVDDKLALLDRVLPADQNFSRTFLGPIVPESVSEAEPPEGETTQKKKNESAADAIAAASGLPARKKGA